MEFLKKYGLYIVLFAVTVTLGSAGYISENRKEEEKIAEKVYLPEAREVPAEEVSALPLHPVTAVKAEKAEDEEKYVYPVSGEPFLSYSENEFIYSKTMKDFRVHKGLDFMCNEGEEVASAGAGQVSDIYNDGFLGLCIEIEHKDGIKTRYCSLAEVLTSVGDTVRAGEKIAVAGNTSRIESAEGIHLHFEVMKDGNTVNPDIIFSQK